MEASEVPAAKRKARSNGGRHPSVARVTVARSNPRSGGHNGWLTSVITYKIKEVERGWLVQASQGGRTLVEVQGTNRHEAVHAMLAEIGMGIVGALIPPVT